MLDRDWARLFVAAEKAAKLKAKGKTYLLSPRAQEVLATVSQCLNRRSIRRKITLNRALNQVEIEVKDYVFDSSLDDLRSVLPLMDGYTIDALKNGQVCIQMTVADACTILD